MNILFLPTIQSTGTWFCINLLRTHSAIVHFATASEWDDAMFTEWTAQGLLQVHFGEGKAGKEVRSFWPKPKVEAMVSSYSSVGQHIVVPVRDPLLALITSHVRDPDQPLDHIIDGFLSLSAWTQKYDISVIPVDLYATRSEKDRHSLLCSIFEKLDLSIEPYLQAWAVHWPVMNTIGERLGGSIKAAYYNRQIEKIANSMPEAYEKLTKSEDMMRPFLEKVGYDNLPWWT